MLYVQQGDEPGDGDPIAGLADSPSLAFLIVAAVNALPGCVEPCGFGCEIGPAHCAWLHEPSHKPGWHGPDECPWTAAAGGGVP
jgi:hypothetical protein